jgi:hypothetical protein
VKLFAGFWRDGAVVQPEARHFVDNYIVGICKDSEQYSLFFHTIKKWHGVYWLDTTTPTELSPQEAFELLKVINPDAERLEDDGGDWCLVGPGSDIINWGDLTEYPPKQSWRVPTEADRGKKCRYKDHENREWIANADRVFWSNWPNGFVVQADGKYPIVYRFCEVQDDA